MCVKRLLVRVYQNKRALSTAATASVSIPHYGEISATNQYEHLAKVMTPLWQVPYEEQLNIKYKWAKGVIGDISTNLRKKHRKRCFPFIKKVEPSPVIESYRNKDEFHVRNGVDKNPKTVGFFVGSPASGSVVCIPGTQLICARRVHMDIAEAFQHYIRKSNLAACHIFHDGGHWRGLTVRSTVGGQTMAIAVCHPQDLSEERLQEEREQLKDYFLNGEGKCCLPDSLYFQACRNTRCTHKEAPFVLLHGEQHLIETLNGLKIRISPDSFFQTNTLAADVLYNIVLKVADVSQRTTLLDLCCGTGVISLLASQKVRGAVGIEALESTVKDARYNARINNISNADFFVGLAEKRLTRILHELEMSPEIVAVVNPSRSGLASTAIHVLCECPQIKCLVYVSCQADAPNTRSNFLQLCTQGNFSLTNVVPVDMFPHTLHTELVMVFER